MSLSPNVRIALAGCALVLTAGALAVPWYSSRTLAAELQALAATHGQGELRIRNLAHEAGWLSSKGALDVEWRNQCADNPEGPAVMHLEYSARHVPDLQGLTRLEWSATPGGAAVGAASQWLGGSKLTGTGRAGYDGTLSTDMQLPELTMNAEGESLQVTPSKGRMVLGKTSLQFDWTFERMALRGNGKALEAKQIALQLDLNNRTVGTGRMAVDIESISTADLTLQGLRVASETSERADRLDSRVIESVRSVQFMGQSLKDLVLEAEVKGVHTASVQTISKVFGESCGLQNATADEQQQLRAAIQKLLASGFSMGIPKLQGSGHEGSLDGKLLLTLAPAQGDAVALAHQLSTSGQLTIKGKLMPPEQRAFAMSTGYATEVPDGVQAAFEYDKGVLKVSGKTLDGAMVQMGLQKLDGWLQAFLQGKSLEPVEEEVPVVAPAEAPAATPAS